MWEVVRKEGRLFNFHHFKSYLTSFCVPKGLTKQSLCGSLTHLQSQVSYILKVSQKEESAQSVTPPAWNTAWWEVHKPLVSQAEPPGSLLLMVQAAIVWLLHGAAYCEIPQSHVLCVCLMLLKVWFLPTLKSLLHFVWMGDWQSSGVTLHSGMFIEKNGERKMNGSSGFYFFFLVWTDSFKPSFTLFINLISSKCLNQYFHWCINVQTLPS